MKKLKLKLDDLEVSTFAAEEARGRTGTVHGLHTHDFQCPSFVETQCQLHCTRVEGCYPSYYCSYIGPGMPNNSCGDGCMTDNNANC
jgi:hypothetical protein